MTPETFTAWVTALLSLFLAATQVYQIVLQILAAAQARRIGAKASSAAAHAETAAYAAQNAAHEAKVERRLASEKADATLSVVETVHTLVNNDMHLALEGNAKLARQVADLLGTPATRVAAEEAEKKLAAHDARQASVDAMAEEKRGQP